MATDQYLYIINSDIKSKCINEGKIMLPFKNLR